MLKNFPIRTITFALLLGAILFVLGASLASASNVSVGVVVNVAPPPLPVYTQPPCPGPDYLWTPGYWDWDGNDYYWVPGTWVEAPDPGLFWTPGYWAWGNGGYIYNAGYWGPAVGFYGGIDYGFGYDGHGYEGGRWNGGHFYYNTAVNNVNVKIVHDTYVDRNVAANNNNRASFNGGNGGVNARATRRKKPQPEITVWAQSPRKRNRPRRRAPISNSTPPITTALRPSQLHRDRAHSPAAES
jgi:hypothetical protein